VAIFGKADADMALLSQVYQVDPDDPDELNHVAHLWIDRPLFAGLSPQERTECLRDFGNLCRLTQEIMRTLHERGGITFEQGGALNVYLRRFPLVLTDPLRAELQPVPLEGEGAGFTHVHIIPIKEIRKVRWTRELKDTAALDLIHQIEQLFRLLAEGRTRLSKCAACSSVFVERRSGQQFCSHRCANRLNKRRRRGEQRSPAVLLKSA